MVHQSIRGRFGSLASSSVSLGAGVPSSNLSASRTALVSTTIFRFPFVSVPSPSSGSGPAKTETDERNFEGAAAESRFASRIEGPGEEEVVAVADLGDPGAVGTVLCATTSAKNASEANLTFGCALSVFHA